MWTDTSQAKPLQRRRDRQRDREDYGGRRPARPRGEGHLHLAGARALAAIKDSTV